MNTSTDRIEKQGLFLDSTHPHHVNRILVPGCHCLNSPHYPEAQQQGHDVLCETCTFTGPLDFANNAYYVYVSITATDQVSDPRLYELAIY